MPVIVTAGPQDTNDQVIKKFKKKILQDDLVTKIKEKEFYKKPSLVKKEKLAEFRKRRKRHLQAKRRNPNY
jgi:ribosomal protein S21